MRGLILGLFLLTATSLTGATPTEASKVNEAEQAVVPYIPLHVFDGTEGRILIIQTGHFNCAGNEHRSFVVTQNGLVLPGCADIQTDEIVVKLETGVVIKFPYKSVVS